MTFHPVVCVIPAYNAEKSVEKVVVSVKKQVPELYVIGVNDGSTDDTGEVLRRSCDETIHFAANKGKGAALRAAFASDTIRNSASIVLTIDADGQHDTAFAPQLIAGLSESDIVIGTRAINTQAVPAVRRAANLVSSAATRLVARQQIPDSQSGYRAIKAEVIRNVHAVGDRYEFETDFLVRASLAGYKITGVTIPTIYGPPSHFRAFRDAWLVTRVLWSHRGALFR